MAHTLVTLKTGLDWEQAHTILKAGGLVNHNHWNHEGKPTALRLVDDRYVVVEADEQAKPKKSGKAGISPPLHTWRPSEAEFASTDWQEVTFRNV